MIDNGKETMTSETESLIVAKLNARVQPRDRFDVYEEKLDAFLKEQALGAVCGGGTQLDESGEVQYCDIEVSLSRTDDEALALLQEKLESLGAPKGSLLTVGDDRKIPFGLNEGLAVYHNGTDLPDNVYQECDINLVWDEFEKLIGPQGEIQGHWEGPTETALYLYGPSYETMLNQIRPFLDNYPLCANARCEKIA